MKRLLIPLMMVAATTFSSHSLAETPADQRQEVSLNPTQKAFVLGHMKNMLETIARINRHLASQQPERVAQLVKEMQQESQKQKPKGIGKSFPDGFRSISKQMNMHWKELMTPTSDVGKVNGKMADILNQCNACHRSYKLK